MEARARSCFGLEEILHQREIGQDEAGTWSPGDPALPRRHRRPDKPIRLLPLPGHQGVGKTELAKALAQALFDDEQTWSNRLSEYMEKFSVSRSSERLRDTWGTGGRAAAKRSRASPTAWLLFDEVEKAHPDVFNFLLQVLSTGRITDSQGRPWTS
jgi:ATP-dependent Clp protease ATP-binding subunit ClpA